jgi:hypothetical protein
MRTILLLTTLVLIALAGEVVLRFLLPLGTVVWRVNEEYLHEYVPGARKLFIHHPANGGDWIRVEINRDGFRGEPLAPKEESERILVYGDSFVAAEFTPLSETFVARLGERLYEITGTRYQMINAGVVAYGPDQVARRLVADLARLEPEAVVLAITAGNDFGDLVRNKLYRVAPDGGVAPASFEIALQTRAQLQHRPLTELGWTRLMRAVRRGLSQRFGALSREQPERPRPVATRLLERCQRDADEYADPIVRRIFADHYDADVSLLPDSPMAHTKRALMTGVLAAIGETTRRAGVPLLVVVIPSPIDVTEDHFGLVVDWSLYPGYRRSALTDAVVTAARAHDLDTLDLFAAFRENEPESLYFAHGNDHWNSRGQALAARLTAERLAPRLED